MCGSLETYCYDCARSVHPEYWPIEITGIKGPGTFDPEDSDADLVWLAQAYLESLRLYEEPKVTARQAWDRLFQKYAPYVRDQVRMHLKRRLPWEDCVQELWRHLLLKLPRFRHDPQRGRFCAWLRTVVRHFAIDFARSQRKPAPCPLEGDLVDELLDDHPEPSADCERVEVVEVFWEIMDELRAQVPAETYQLFEDRLILRRPVEELAEQFHMTSSQVRVCHHRMKIRFRALFAKRVGKEFFCH